MGDRYVLHLLQIFMKEHRLIICTLFVFFLSLTACKKDDSIDIKGKWAITEVTVITQTNDATATISESDSGVHFEFFEGGKGTFTNGAGTSNIAYTLSGSNLIIKFNLSLTRNYVIKKLTANEMVLFTDALMQMVGSRTTEESRYVRVRD